MMASYLGIKADADLTATSRTTPWLLQKIEEVYDAATRYYNDMREETVKRTMRKVRHNLISIIPLASPSLHIYRS